MTAHSTASHDVAMECGLHYLHAGSGQPLVLLHGWPTGGEVWSGQLDGLSSVAHVIAPDLPGYGASAASTAVTLADLAAVVHHLLIELSLEDVVLGGWSMGGGVTLSYLEQFGSDRLSAAIVVDDCPCLLPKEGWELGVDTTFNSALVDGWRERWRSDRAAVVHELSVMEFAQPDLFPSAISWLDELSSRADPDAAITHLVDSFMCDFRQGLGMIQVPVLLAYGAKSRLTTRAAREMMRDTIPNATLEVFAESGHNPFIEQRDDFNSVLRSFLQRLKSPHVTPVITVKSEV